MSGRGERAAFEGWLRNYHGSIDTTALELCWQAATERASAALEARAEEIKHTSHADGLGMGCLALENELKWQAAAIREGGE